MTGDAVKIFYCAVSRVQMPDILSFLSEQEKIRHERFRDPAAARHFLIGRFLAKKVIGGMMGIDPGFVRLEIGLYGRPRLKSPRPGGFDFNLAHSGDLVALAAGPGRVGIDIEKLRPIDPEIARSHFTKEEMDYILAGKKNIRKKFFMIWTLKEAYVKAVGKGFFISPASFGFGLGARGEISLKGKGASRGWKFKLYEPQKGYIMAVCVKGGELREEPKKMGLKIYGS